MTDFGPSGRNGERRTLLPWVRNRIALLAERQRRRWQMRRGKPDLHAEFLKRLGYPLDLDNPQTFNAKIQVRKLRDRNPLYPVISDKLRVREFVASVIGKAETESLLVPLLGATDDPTQDWLRGFGSGVIFKANHASGMNFLVHPGTTPDYRDLERRCRRWLAFDYGTYHREWAYTPIPRRIVAEPLLAGADGGVPDDYKFCVFDGRVQLVTIVQGRFGDERNAFFTRDWQPVPVYRQMKLMDRTPDRPAWFSDVRDLAERIAADFDHLRVDFLCTPDRYWLGELTLYFGGGLHPFTPTSYDYELGAHWNQRLHPGQP